MQRVEVSEITLKSTAGEKREEPPAHLVFLLRGQPNVPKRKVVPPAIVPSSDVARTIFRPESVHLVHLLLLRARRGSSKAKGKGRRG
jgi:hypothetical protein